MTNEIASNSTLPEVARRLHYAEHQVRYACRRYNISPAARLAHVGLYSPEQVTQIESALARTQAARYHR